MATLDPSKAIVPIVIATGNDPIKEILGTGAFIGTGENLVILTARHVFESSQLLEGDRYAFVLKDGKGIGIWAINQVIASEDYDIAVCRIQYQTGMMSLPFSKQQPPLNSDVVSYEYSSTIMEAKPQGGKHVSFQPLTHKGNIMRYFDSDFPEKVITPSFNTSFPALQGASGAPVIAASEAKHFYIAGILVANQETHLMPAQVVSIVDGDNYLEETSYFLPMGKGINAQLVSQVVEGLQIEVDYVE